MIDRRLAGTALVVVAFGAGFGVHALLFRERSPLPVLAPLAHAPVSVPASASASASTLTPPAPPSSAALQEVFDDIYRHARWGKNAEDAGSSGYGSSLGATLLYRTFLVDLLKDTAVHSVVDAGCGDWESSSAIDWKGIDYKGYDIVASVIESDTKKYGKPNVHFFTANIVDDELPPADLLIVKHVLQHLPNAAVQKFLTQLPKYKHVLLVDSVNPVTLSGKNVDITPGAFRELDVTRPPFDVRGAKVLTYWDGGNMQQAVYASPQP